MAKKTVYYGGQAVLEGVMMRGQKHYGIAVRQENNEISTTVKGLSTVLSGRVRKIPFVRGIIALVETLILGVRSLMYSADVFMGEEEIKGKSWMLWLSLLVGMALAIGLFIGIPLGITYALKPHLTSNILFNIVNGLVRLVIITTYMWAIGYMKDIRRVFAYHGAEHKTINAYEDGAELEVESVKQYSTAHPRCGTSFLLIIMVLAIIAYMFIPRDIPFYLRFLYQLAILPAIAAVSYELIRISARCFKNRIVKALLVPGMFLQKLTTREPDDEQLEVGITALKLVLDAENTAQAAGEINV